MTTKVSAKNLFKAIETYYNQSSPVKISDLENLFSKNFKLERNGAVLSEGLSEYVTYVEKIRSRYSKAKFVLSNDEPIVSDNKMVVQYTMNLTTQSEVLNLSSRSQEKETSVVIMAIFTFEGEKVARWQQVANEKGHTAL